MLACVIISTVALSSSNELLAYNALTKVTAVEHTTILYIAHLDIHYATLTVNLELKWAILHNLRAIPVRSTDKPKRVVLRYSVQYEREEAAINEQFFARRGPEPPNKDFFSHIMGPNEPSKMHIVLDINCNSHPTIDTNMIAYEVFKVRKSGNFKFEKIDAAACQYARKRCELIGVKWGTNRSLV
ncbi:hypothetical protein PMIN03_004298 [Paraphaeosphaeria minitans]